MAHKVRVQTSKKTKLHSKKVRKEGDGNVQGLGEKVRDDEDVGGQSGSSRDAGSAGSAGGSGGLGSVAIIVGGIAAAGGVAAAVAGGGGNKAPVFSSPSATATVAEDGTVNVALSATDSDPLTYTVSAPANGSASVSGGNVIYTPKKDFNGTDTFTITASDGKLSSVQTVTVTVTAANDAPVITSGATAAVAENAAVSTVVYTAAATDVDAGDTRTFSLTGTDAALFNIDSATGVVTLKASANYEAKASYNINVVATDRAGLTASQAVVVSVTDVNEAPVITSVATASVAENAAASTVVYTATASDVDAGDARTFSLAGADAALFNIDSATGAVTLKASANYEAKASYNINVVATDRAGLTASQAVVVSVTDVNEAPVITSVATASVAENAAISTVVYTATASDVDAGDARTFSLAGADAALFNIDSATGVVTLKASANYEAKASYNINVVATDRAGLTASQAVVVNVTDVNEAPVITSDATRSITVNEDTGAVFAIDATDPDVGAVLSASIATGPANGRLSTDGAGQNIYTPNANFNGTDSFVIRVSDGTLATSYTVNVTVTPVNDAPTFAAASQAVTTDEDVAKAVTLAATDVDGDALVYTAGAAANGTVVVSGNTATYTPRADFNGADSFVVTASDGKGGTTTQTVNVTVTPVDDSIDVLDDTTATTYTATSGVIDVFTDNSSQKTNAIITGMTSEDKVVVSGASTDYSFTSVGSDIQITYNNTTSGVVNVMVLKGIAGSGFISDEASAEASVGWNFFTALTQPNGSGGSGTAGTGGNLDIDNDANTLTQATITATGANAYTEDANVGNYVKINGFGGDDTITVSNALTSNYSFTSEGTDIHITYTNSSGVVNDITLVGVVSAGTYIGSEADAETALGRDFFKNSAVSESADTKSLDIGTSVATATVSGAGASVTFSDSAAQNSYVKITDFTLGDLIQVTGATEDQYSFSSGDLDNDGSADDLSITFSNAGSGVVNDIQILNVVSPTAFVFDKATAQAAVGFNFITFG